MNTKLLPNRFLRILETVPGQTDLQKVQNLLALWYGVNEAKRDKDRLKTKAESSL